MKDKSIPYLMLLILVSPLVLFSQVGINTQNPLGVFHIDPQANTSSVGVNDDDDFIVTDDGKVGIGTTNPQTTLHVNGNMRYSDGYEQAGYILRSRNASGDAYWSEQRLVNPMILPNQSNIETVISNSIYNIKNNSLHYMGLSITLPWAGRWKVFFKANYRQYTQGNKAYYILWYLSASATVNTNIEKAYSGYSGSAFDSRPIMVTSNCTFIVNISTPNTSVYLWADGYTLTMSASEFNIPYVPGDGLNFWALPMN